MSEKGKDEGPKKGSDIKFENELEWIKFREEILGPAAYSEPASSKFFRKMKENPFVPVGAGATLCALTYGLWCFRQGRMRDSQMMMRARVSAQGFTIVAMLAGVYFGLSTTKQSTPPIAEAAPAKASAK